MRVKLTQYAKMTGVSVRTLWRRINDGSLPIIKSETGRIRSKRLTEKFIKEVVNE